MHRRAAASQRVGAKENAKVLSIQIQPQVKFKVLIKKAI